MAQVNTPRKLISPLFVSLMVSALVACGGGGGGDVSASSSQSTVSSSAASSLSSSAASSQIQSSTSSSNLNSSGNSSTSAVSSSASSASESSSSAAPLYSIGGSVSGLSGSGLVLQNNGGDNLSLSANGSFVFAGQLLENAAYDVTIAQQPVTPSQTCSLNQAAGTVATSHITNIEITCTTNSYSIGGTLSGLVEGGSLELQNNAGDNLVIDSNGSFTFATELADLSAYVINVLSQPDNQWCEVSPATGALAGAAISNIQVNCVSKPAAPELNLGYGIKEFKFTWDAVENATYYQLYESADGVSEFVQIGGDITATQYTAEVALHNRINASYQLVACNPAGCSPVSPVVTTSENLVEAVGFFSASNADEGDKFGASVALSADGKTLAVGAFREDSLSGDPADNTSISSGAVYVFYKGETGWQQQAYLKASNIDSGDYFGESLALSADGNRLVVGASEERSNATGINGDQLDNSLQQAGAVYVFERNQGAWFQQAYIKASNTGAKDLFGYRLALSGNGQVLAVGAYGEASAATGINGDQQDNSAAKAGAVYVFSENEGVWAQQAYIKASNTDPTDFFGIDLVLSDNGQRLVVGAYGEDGGSAGVSGDPASNTTSQSGAVYVFDTIGGAWQQTAYLKASNTDVGDSFGGRLAISADGLRLAVGARYEDSQATGIDGDQLDNSSATSGAVYVFDEGEQGWVQSAYIKASNAEADDEFGWLAMAADGQTLVVGTEREESTAVGINGDQQDNTASGNRGAAYVFRLVGQQWQQAAYLKATVPDDTVLGAGLAVSQDGSTVAVGATSSGGNPQGISAGSSETLLERTGAVFLF